MPLDAISDMTETFRKMSDNKIKKLYENRQNKFTPEILILLQNEYTKRNLFNVIASSNNVDKSNNLASAETLTSSLLALNKEYSEIKINVSFWDIFGKFSFAAATMLFVSFITGICIFLAYAFFELLRYFNISESLSVGITVFLYTFIGCAFAFSDIAAPLAQEKMKEIKNKYSNIASQQIQALINHKDVLENYNALQEDNEDIISNQKEKISQLENIRDNVFNSNKISYPWIAKLYADLHYIYDSKTAYFLKIKKNPAIKASEEVTKIAKEKRELLEKYKMLEYQLNYYEKVFPWLEDFKEIDAIETYENLNNLDETSTDEYSKLKNWLSPEEYQKLSSAEKYQLALDRYKNRQNKSNWEIGIEYERYIGYLYEAKGYKVIYNGALEGLNDFGRDIIAESKDKVLIIQCKYWKKEKTIHEKHIFQLYGTMILKKLATNKKVHGVFITSASLSDVAKRVAEELKIEVVENKSMDKEYPCIKCNINRQSGEKIYHLPFDQQYDKVLIEANKGEIYVNTVSQAEQLGFRRASKWISY